MRRQPGPCTILVAPQEVVVTLPIDILLNLTMGSSVALVAKRAVAVDGVVRSVPLGALLLFQLMIFLPVGAWLLHEYPDWMIMYLVEPAALPMPPWTLALSLPVAGIVGFFVVRNLIRQSKLGAALGWTGGCLLVAVAVSGFGYRQVLGVGTTSSFRNDLPLQPLEQTPLTYMLLAAGIAVALGWGATLWRLAAFSRAARFQGGALEQTLVREAPNTADQDPTRPPVPEKKDKKVRRARRPTAKKSKKT